MHAARRTASDHRRVLARLITCSALALTLVVAPAAARADGDPPAVPVPAAAPLMSTAHALAVARWGMDPCGGQVSVVWNHMGAGINARSQWMSIDTHDPATFSDCSITYNLDVDWDWPKLCTVIEHELGHLSGHDHVNDPHDVMSPYYIYPAPECAAGASAAPAATPDAAPRKAKSATSSRRARSGKRKATAKRRAKARSARAKKAHAKKARAGR